MDFKKKYALLDLIPGDGASSYRGRQLASGRDVTVHLLRGAPAENDDFLSRIRALPPESLRQVVEIGEQDGTVYLVTAAPPHRHVSEWLSEQDATSAEPGEFTQFFQPNSFRPPAGIANTGEFTRLFGPGSPVQPADVSQINTPKPEQGSGEYTRLIAQSLTSGALPPEQSSAVPLAAPVQSTSLKFPPAAPRMVSPLVTLILCLLAFAFGGALVFLILRH